MQHAPTVSYNLNYFYQLCAHKQLDNNWIKNVESLDLPVRQWYSLLKVVRPVKIVKNLSKQRPTFMRSIRCPKITETGMLEEQDMEQQAQYIESLEDNIVYQS